MEISRIGRRAEGARRAALRRGEDAQDEPAARARQWGYQGQLSRQLAEANRALADAHKAARREGRRAERQHGWSEAAKQRAYEGTRRTRLLQLAADGSPKN